MIIKINNVYQCSVDGCKFTAKDCTLVEAEDFHKLCFYKCQSSATSSSSNLPNTGLRAQLAKSEREKQELQAKLAHATQMQNAGFPGAAAVVAGGVQIPSIGGRGGSSSAAAVQPSYISQQNHGGADANRRIEAAEVRGQRGGDDRKFARPGGKEDHKTSRHTSSRHASSSSRPITAVVDDRRGMGGGGGRSSSGTGGQRRSRSPLRRLDQQAEEQRCDYRPHHQEHQQRRGGEQHGSGSTKYDRHQGREGGGIEKENRNSSSGRGRHLPNIRSSGGDFSSAPDQRNLARQQPMGGTPRYENYYSNNLADVAGALVDRFGGELDRYNSAAANLSAPSANSGSTADPSFEMFRLAADVLHNDDVDKVQMFRSRAIQDDPNEVEELNEIKQDVCREADMESQTFDQRNLAHQQQMTGPPRHHQNRYYNTNAAAGLGHNYAMVGQQRQPPPTIGVAEELRTSPDWVERALSGMDPQHPSGQQTPAGGEGGSFGTPGVSGHGQSGFQQQQQPDDGEQQPQPSTSSSSYSTETGGAGTG